MSHDRHYTDEQSADNTCPDFLFSIRILTQDTFRCVRAERIEGPFLVTYHIIEREMRDEKYGRYQCPEIKRQRNDPQQCDGLLERRTPVVMFLILLPILPQVERQLDGMIDKINAIAEAIGKHYILPFQSERLYSYRSEQEMR